MPDRGDNIDNPMRSLPSVDEVLRALEPQVGQYGHQQVVQAVRIACSALRDELLLGMAVGDPMASICSQVEQDLQAAGVPRQKRVLNLTGTVLHTNLGRAVLADEAIKAVVACARGATNLEFDLVSGQRGDRDDLVQDLVCELTGAQAATFVNNNAAAVLLTLNTLARDKEVPVSRGELVEIGGSFRIPEVMERSGARLIEVGATNRTHLRDYAAAISDRTALLMKVHTSNYRIEGFASSVTESELVALAAEHQLPVVIDLGSGCLTDMAALGLPAEPTVAEVMNTGVDLVTFSGDKLLGGPQCGVIAGRRELVEAIRRNPLKRALRCDKMTLAALAETLRLYRDSDTLPARLPALRALTRDPQELETLAESILPAVLAGVGEHYRVTSRSCQSQIGSGALPVETMPSVALVITPVSGEDSDLRRLAEALRGLPIPVLGRLHEGSLWLDLRCLEEADELVDQLAIIWEPRG